MSYYRIVLLTSIAVLGGCYKNTIKTGLQPGASSDHKAKFYIGGLVGEADFNMDQICPSGVAKIEESMEVPDVLLACVTCSIYTPVTVKVTCASGAAWHLMEDEVNGRTLVAATTITPLAPIDDGA